MENEYQSYIALFLKGKENGELRIVETCNEAENLVEKFSKVEKEISDNSDDEVEFAVGVICDETVLPTIIKRHDFFSSRKTFQDSVDYMTRVIGALREPAEQVAVTTMLHVMVNTLSDNYFLIPKKNHEK